MKMFKNKNKITVARFEITFKTVDNEYHKYITRDFYDTDKIVDGNFLTYFLINKDFLYDNEYNAYPMDNIIKITAKESITKVVEEKNDFTVCYYE